MSVPPGYVEECEANDEAIRREREYEALLAKVAQLEQRVAELESYVRGRKARETLRR